MTATSPSPGLPNGDFGNQGDRLGQKVDHGGDYALLQVVHTGAPAGGETTAGTASIGTDVTRVGPTATPEDVRAAMATMPIIEQAKGILMVSHGLTADAAFALLRWHSQQRNIKVRDLAAVLIHNLGTGAPRGSISLTV